MYLIIRILINVAAILIIAHIFPKLIQVEGFGAALIAALVSQALQFLIGLECSREVRLQFERPSEAGIYVDQIFTGDLVDFMGELKGLSIMDHGFRDCIQAKGGISSQGEII